MVNYNCLRCGYETNIKTILVRHLSRKIPCKAIYEDIPTKHLKQKLLENEYKKECENLTLKEPFLNPGAKKFTLNESKMNPNESKMNPNESKMNPNESKMSDNESKMNPNESKMNPNESKMNPNESKNEYKCKYCEKSYTTNSNLNKHLKSCKEKAKDDDQKDNLLHLVDMLNLQLKEQNEQKVQLKEQKEQLNEELKRRDKQIEEQNKQINELIKKAGITQNIQNIQNNFKVLAYKNTDLSHLTDQDYIQCLNRSNMVIPNLIKKIHFNPKKPENHNIYISNIKNKYVMIYDGTKWDLCSRDETIDDLIDTNEMVIEQKLEEWLENGKEYPEIMKKFNRYLEKKEKDEVINKIKEEIRLILFNNRNVIDKDSKKAIDI